MARQPLGSKDAYVLPMASRSQAAPESGVAGNLVLWAFLAEAILAGGNSVAIRFSNRELEPLWGATTRFAIAAILVAAISVSMRVGLPRGRLLAGATAFGLFQFAGAFGLYYFALVEIQAGLGQTMLALVPLATLLVAVAVGLEAWRLSGALGAVISLIGVVVMSRGPLSDSVSWVSVLAVLGSVLCFAAALVTVRRLPPIHPVALNTVGMAVSVPVLAAAALLRSEAFVLPTRPETWVAIGFVAAVGSVIVFLLHVFVAQNWQASRASYVMVLVPMVTVALSAWLDQEPVNSGLIVGGLLIVLGVYVGALRRQPE